MVDTKDARFLQKIPRLCGLSRGPAGNHFGEQDQPNLTLVAAQAPRGDRDVRQPVRKPAPVRLRFGQLQASKNFQTSWYHRVGHQPQETAGTLLPAAANMIATRCASVHESGMTTTPPPGLRPRALMAVSISTSL
jgi:hypothetical protein